MALRTRVAILLCLALVPLVAAGCGDGSGASKASSPLDEGLSYMPKDAPLVISLETDLNGTQYQNLNGLLNKFPLAGQIKNGIVQLLESGSTRVDFNSDIKPLLGNEFVIGVTDVRTLQKDDSDFVGAIQVKDKSKLRDVLKKTGAKEQGDKSGAKLYKGKDKGDTFAAVKDDVLIVARTKPILERALARREGDDHFSEADFDKGTEGVPKTALARVYANLADVLKADPNSREALNSKWVKSIKTLGATVTAESSGLKAAFKLKTDGLSETDVPLATGGQSPGVISQPGRFSFGLRGANQLLEFAQKTGQAVNPTAYGQFQTGKQQIQTQLGVDLDKDLIQQLDGDTSVVVGVDGQFGARAELKDPKAFEATLNKAAKVLPSVAGSIGGPGAKIKTPKGGKGLYSLSATNGRNLVFGVIKDSFVIAKDRAEAATLAAGKPGAVPGAKGAFAFQADAKSVAQQAIFQLGGGGSGLNNLGGSLFTGPLGQLTGSIDSETDGLSGSFELGVK